MEHNIITVVYSEIVSKTDSSLETWCDFCSYR